MSVNKDRWAGAPLRARLGAEAAERAHAMEGSLHLPRARDAYRELLLEAKNAFESALDEEAAAERPRDGETEDERGDSHSVEPDWRLPCRRALAAVYAAHAEDARYGAGQLSRGAQRAPTEADCDDGWQRVEEIVRGAEASAEKSQAMARKDGAARVARLAGQAARSAEAARALITERNHAYTFHADPSFSFGEGWYAAAAAVLTGVTLQLEPDKKHSLAALQFLTAAGLAKQLQPYRPRPRANKALPLLVADAFRLDPLGCQKRLRDAFLSAAENVREVRPWLHARLPRPNGRRSALVWVRQGAHDAHRNSSQTELTALSAWLAESGLCPIFIGDSLGGMPVPREALDLTLFWKEPLFQGLHMRRAQLEVFECLRADWHLAGQLGVTTAGMDGPALLGLPTLYLTEEPNLRLGRWVGAIPRYEELVRPSGQRGPMAASVRAWARRL